MNPSRFGLRSTEDDETATVGGVFSWARGSDIACLGRRLRQTAGLGDTGRPRNGWAGSVDRGGAGTGSQYDAGCES